MYVCEREGSYVYSFVYLCVCVCVCMCVCVCAWYHQENRAGLGGGSVVDLTLGCAFLRVCVYMCA